jgi:DNA-binding XRE family transcriptional regulator
LQAYLLIRECAGTLTIVTARTVNELGASIRRARKERGWTQDDLATRAGISRRTLVAIEGGSSRGEIGIVLRVIAALDRELTISERTSRDGDDLLGHVSGTAE